jgi:hypothetical protein
MAADDFFARWSKKNSEAQQDASPVAAPDAAVPTSSVPAAAKTLPTLEDAGRLTPDADFSAFMAQGVDEGVKRAAMKKLFSDPHFNVMDGLDVYIDDYNKFEALTPDIIATLNHAKDLLDPLSQSAAPTMRLLDALDEEADAAQLAVQAAPSAETKEEVTRIDHERSSPDDQEQTRPAGSGTPPVPD